MEGHLPSVVSGLPLFWYLSYRSMEHFGNIFNILTKEKSANHLIYCD